jgi:hypothetical protein
VAGEEDTGWDPVEPLGSPLRPARRDVLGSTVLPVVEDAATNASDHHQEAHDRCRRSHGYILPDSGF